VPLGLDVGGPLIGTAEAVVRPSDTPVDSRAVFQVTADADGNVTGVALLDASQARGSWERVAPALAKALRVRRLTMRGHHGAVITLEVTSRRVTPSGSKPGKPWSDPKVHPTDSGVAFSVRFDATDIGARLLRDVHARVLAESYP
jgi:hypothetical protein